MSLYCVSCGGKSYSESMEVGIDTNIEEAGKSEDCAVSDGREVEE